MGILVSQTERTQFVEALKVAREIGWADSKIAQQLGVANGKYAGMRQGFVAPSAKHVHRINELLKSTPPRSVLPPTPPPKESTTVVAKPETIAFVGDDGGAPRHAWNDKPLKEEPMQTTTETNGMSHNPKAVGAAEPGRNPLLPPNIVKLLRSAMKEALATKFGGDLDKMADALSITKKGLFLVLTKTTGSISQRTMNQFASATGWPVPSEEELAADKPARTIRRSATNEPDNSYLSESQNKRFAGEVRAEGRRIGSMAELGRRAGISGSTLGLVASNKAGSTHATYERFKDYIEKRKAPQRRSPRRATATEATSPAAPVVQERAARTSSPKLDLYAMAGQLLACGQSKQAHLLSLVALASERASADQIAEALRTLAGTG
jgi:transcriptional regulator with XRE-family HTH domain